MLVEAAGLLVVNAGFARVADAGAVAAPLNEGAGLLPLLDEGTPRLDAGKLEGRSRIHLVIGGFDVEALPLFQQGHPALQLKQANGKGG